jgi:hypothetical protein
MNSRRRRHRRAGGGERAKRRVRVGASRGFPRGGGLVDVGAAHRVAPDRYASRIWPRRRGTRRRGQGPKETNGVLQLAADVRYKRDAFYTGARLATVFGLSRAGTETFVSIYPNIGLDFERVFVDGGLLVNLNEPLGPFFGGERVWSFRLNGGARF